MPGIPNLDGRHTIMAHLPVMRQTNGNAIDNEGTEGRYHAAATTEVTGGG